MDRSGRLAGFARGSGHAVRSLGKQVTLTGNAMRTQLLKQKMMKQFKKSPKGFARKLGGLMGNPGAFRGMK